MKKSHRILLKLAIWLGALFPLADLVWRGFHQNLGANPVERVQHGTGDWALNFLLITLAITPLRRLLRLPWLISFRRMLGLFAFFYAVLHLTTYVWLDQSFDVAAMWKDVYKRPFITVGFTAFVLLIPLAITSTRGWIRRLGGKNWALLHKAIYLSAICGVIHYYWLVKKDVTMPVRYAIVLAVLLLYRVAVWLWQKKAAAPGGLVTAEDV